MDRRHIRYTLRILWEEGTLAALFSGSQWNKEARQYDLLHRHYPNLDLNQIAEEDADRIVVRAYFAAYGPSTEQDAAWWTGLSMLRLRRAIAAIHTDFRRVCVDNIELPCLVSVEALDCRPLQSIPCTRLLPLEDNLLKGYSVSRARFFKNSVNLRRATNAAGEAKPLILDDGAIVGTWRCQNGSDFETELFGANSPQFARRLEFEVERLEELGILGQSLPRERSLLICGGD